MCKVHGCTREVILDKESQLRAWAALGTADLQATVALPKRMCEVCREFCRNHSDREIACGRAGCDRTWVYKTGAQLQAFLAGRLEDPVRLCPECSTAELPVDASATAAGQELMPCIVPGCDGIWHFWPELEVAPARDGELPPDRMCDPHRASLHGLGPRGPIAQAYAEEATRQADASSLHPEDAADEGRPLDDGSEFSSRDPSDAGVGAT